MSTNPGRVRVSPAAGAAGCAASTRVKAGMLLVFMIIAAVPVGAAASPGPREEWTEVLGLLTSAQSEDALLPRALRRFEA